MRTTKNADAIKFICDCGYETKWFKTRPNIEKLLLSVIQDGGEVMYSLVGNKCDVQGSICPQCRMKNSFDIDCKYMLQDNQYATVNVIERI